MNSNHEYDAVVVGSGPNGLAAAITMARAGRSVLVLEAEDTPGGGARTAEITLPGFWHDVCSAVHPLGLASPFFRDLPLNDFGLEWVHPPAAVAHPLDGGRAALLSGDVAETAASLGADEGAYRRLFSAAVQDWEKIMVDFLGPLPLLPRYPLAMLRFGVKAALPARILAQLAFRTDEARALFAGMAAHAMLALEEPISAAFGLMLGTLGHAVGWPVARRGSGSITNALVAYLRSLGGEVCTRHPVRTMADVPPSSSVFFDLTPRQILEIAAERLPAGYRSWLERFRYGSGVFKVDWALDGPIPWQAQALRRAGTVHLGGTLEEVSAAERLVRRGEHPERPFVLLAQQSLFDPTRAPAGKHTAWAYCHVPNGSDVDMTLAIEDQVERFAPGFRDLILARATHSAVQMNAYNANYVGGDINGGLQNLWGHVVRPAPRPIPYSMPVEGMYICSSSTPPGGGVHGMCGYRAANAALKAGF